MAFITTPFPAVTQKKGTFVLKAELLSGSLEITRKEG